MGCISSDQNQIQINNYYLGNEESEKKKKKTQVNTRLHRNYEWLISIKSFKNPLQNPQK